MSARFFIDTNIIIYSFDSLVPDKRSIAQQLITKALSGGNGVISSQVFQEFVNFALKTKNNPMSLEQVRRYSNKVLRALCRVQSSFDLYQNAFNIKEKTKFSWYDSLIIAGALEADCEILYSEDLQHSQNIQGLVIVNPFL
jgi:predicted nucleic acid-binding protein